jgi:hypothetical protein
MFVDLGISYKVIILKNKVGFIAEYKNTAMNAVYVNTMKVTNKF